MQTAHLPVKPALNGGFGTPPVIPPAGSTPPSVAVRHTVDAHSLPHKKLTKTQRALLGAAILDGEVALINHTREVVAKAVNASASYIDAARRLSPEQRREVARGSRSLARRKAPTPVLTAAQRFEAVVAEVGGLGAAQNLLAMIERKTA